MQPLDVLMWAGTGALSLVVLALGAGVAIVIVNTARQTKSAAEREALAELEQAKRQRHADEQHVEDMRRQIAEAEARRDAAVMKRRRPGPYAKHDDGTDD